MLALDESAGWILWVIAITAIIGFIVLLLSTSSSGIGEFLKVTF
jgi:uncharacterized membrane-anchored protein